MQITDRSNSETTSAQSEVRLSVIIPVRIGEFPHKAIDCLSRANLPPGITELILAEGRTPSRQRNEAIRDASGDILYFLDDDSYVKSDAISEGLQFFTDAQVDVVGGPALTHMGATFLEHCIGEVVSSSFGTGITRARNKPLGDTRIVKGEELVLCNLMIRKTACQQVSGLNTRLFPGEDPEFVKRLSARGALMYYHPKMVVYRTRRKSALSFVKQSFTYGRGRGLHILQGTRLQDLLFCGPTLFLFYVLSLLLLQSTVFLIPLFIYMILASATAVSIGINNRSALMSVCAFPLFPLLHLSYGAGMAYGLAVYLSQSSKEKLSPIHIRVLRLAGESREAALAGSRR